ncbi:MAG: serine acetyltransferase [Candidatus Omnitrophota bacterium]
MSLGQLFLYLYEDNRRRRVLLRKSTSFLGMLSSFFSHISAATAIYRLSHYFFCKRLGFLSRFFYVLNIVLFGCDISPMSEIGPGLVIYHLVGNAIHAKIGKNALLHGQNAIGGSGGESDKGWYGGPVIGDNVTMYFGAKVLAPVKIGDNSVIGAASLVLEDVPDNKVVVGIPAKIIRDNNG